MFGKFALVGATLMFSATLAVAEDRKDLQVFKDISASIDRYTQLSVFDEVNASVKEGVVTLTGKVTMPYKRQDIAKLVAKVDGVRQVKDQMTVLPVSTFDDELRYWIARSIYGNSSFWNYAAMPNPPIHIIVEHAHVTLTGVVQSNVERALAQSIAAQFGALSVTNKLKTDAEARALLEEELN
ncbi:MAG: BON domain-containing protein [Acidobacteria bacterium]|nr:BON domain-containing protein [Acidobacteriota bacterium]